MVLCINNTVACPNKHTWLKLTIQVTYNLPSLGMPWSGSPPTGLTRHFTASTGGSLCSVAPLLCQVPQGSILGAISFSLYTLPSGHIINISGCISYHCCFADDTQLYLSAKPNDLTNLVICYEGLAVVKDWTAQNLLQLNPDKTEVFPIHPDHVAKKNYPLIPNIKPSSRNLCVIFDLLKNIFLTVRSKN